MHVEWTPCLAIGVIEIDDQHKELFRRVNELLDKIGDKKSEDDINRAIAFLQNYIMTHLETEERYMARYSYPQYAAHKIQHGLFMADFAAIKRGIKSPGKASVIQVQKRLLDWVTSHMSRTDKTLGIFLNTAQSKKAA